MKQLLFLLLGMSFAACSSDETAPVEPTIEPGTITCQIVAPTNNAEVDPDEPLTIRGEATIENTTVKAVQLKVGEQIIPAVNTIPFSYTYTFPASQPEGNLSLSLAVVSAENRTSTHSVTIRLKRPDGPAAKADIVVAKDGSGHFTTVQEAINSLPSNGTTRKTIFIKAGEYYEKIAVNRPFVTLIGEQAETTVITYDDYAGKPLEGGGELGTQNSAGFTINSTDFMAVNLTFSNPHKNLAGSGQNDQAVAVGVYNDRAVFYNCRLVGYQDTFYVKNAARVYCKDCYIEGNVDFIFGDAVLLCQNCQLHCNRHDSVLTAAADHTNSLYGFTFIDCRITHIEGNDFNGRAFSTFYLGRPWKQNARVVFIRCEEPALLHAAAWRRMSEGVDAALFAEYQCTGAGAAEDRLATREMGGRQLTAEEAATYTLEQIFAAQTNPNKYKSDWLPDPKIEL